MNADDLRSLQAPLKQKYRDDPTAAVVTLRARSTLSDGIACKVDTMNADDLRSLQAPLKQKYRDDPTAAVVTLRARSTLSDGIACKVDTGRALVEAGLHPATGGDGTLACSGDMLLEALVACAGVTLRAVSTALGVELRDATVSVEGDLDFRGTLGVARNAPVGFRAIRLRFELDSDAPAQLLGRVINLTERYCVVLQTLRNAPPIEVGVQSPSSSDGP